MGQYQSVQKGPPKSNSMEIEVIDLESDSDTTVLSTTSDNPDGRNSSSLSSSSGEVPVVENRRQECNSNNRPQPLVQHSFERRNGEVIAVGDYLTRVATTTTTTVNSEEPVGDDVPMTGLITVAPTSKWAEPPSSDEGEEMEEGEITSDEEYGQEKQKKIPNQINPKNINLVMKQGNNVRVTSQGQGRTSSKECAAGTSSTRGDSSNQARMKSPVVTACLESSHPAAPVPDPEVAIMKEQNANLQKTIDSLKQELEQTNQNCSISYVRGKEDGELEFQRKFKSANEEEILKMANGNAVNNSAVALLGHLLELRREKMAIVENTNAELAEKLKKMEGEKDEIFGLLCKSHGKLLSVTEEAVTLEQRVEELRALLVTKDAYIKTLGEDALVVSNAITRIHTTLQTYDSVAVVVPAAADESTPGNQSSLGEPATTTERSSSMVVESQCPPQNEAPVTLQEPTRNEDVRPTSSSKEKESSSSQLPSLFQIPSLAPPVVSRAASKTSTRRTSPKSTRRISTRRRPSPPSRGRDRERGRERKDESHSVTQEERNRILKLLPGLENWQGYTIHDIIFKKYGWTCPQCGDQRRTLHATAAHARDKHVWATCNRCWKRFPYGSPYAKHSKICSPRSTSSSHAPLTSLVKDE